MKEYEYIRGYSIHPPTNFSVWKTDEPKGLRISPLGKMFIIYFIGYSIGFLLLIFIANFVHHLNTAVK